MVASPDAQPRRYDGRIPKPYAEVRLFPIDLVRMDQVSMNKDASIRNMAMAIPLVIQSVAAVAHAVWRA